jgi:hypothetical protein
MSRIMRLVNRLSPLQHRNHLQLSEGKFGNKSHPISHCNCDEFRPYRIRILGEGDNEVIEQQYSEVKNIQWVQYYADNVTNRSPLIISISVKELAKRYRWI